MASYAEVVSGNFPPRQHYNGSESHPNQQPKLLKKSEVRTSQLFWRKK
jgi:hypothetical protein